MKFHACSVVLLLSSLPSVILGQQQQLDSNDNIDASLFASFGCTLSGASADKCDATTTKSGEQCTWCEWNSHGFCVSETQAKSMEQKFNGVTCDCDDDNDKDDDAAANDDDDTGNDFWKCVEAMDAKECKEDHCDWCTTKGGFGMCLTEEAAEIAKDSYWFDCDDNATTTTTANDKTVMTPMEYSFVSNALTVDTGCTTSAVVGGNTQESCFDAKDKTGQSCAWCQLGHFAAHDEHICLSQSQAQKVEIFGAKCDMPPSPPPPPLEVETPYDTACIMAVMKGGMDESTCLKATDSDGQTCEWCSYGKYSLCLSNEQGMIAQQFGVSCDGKTDGATAKTALDTVDAVTYDTSCIIAAVTGGEEACHGASDENGDACEWCSVGEYAACLTKEQADVVEDFGATCDANVTNTQRQQVKDPFDTACLMAEITGNMDESTCLAATDSDGNKCEWCTIAGSYSFCLTEEQGMVAEQLGGSCDTTSVVGVSEAAMIQDPFDTACLIAALEGGEAACHAAKDSDGDACEWCTLSSYSFCLTDEQAEIVEQLGVSCDDGLAQLPNTDNADVKDPFDKACLMAELIDGMDESTCLAATDSDGNKCEWCTLANYNFCLTNEQGMVAEQLGATCDTTTATITAAVNDPFDTACLMAEITGGMDESTCLAATDSDGNKCEWCTLSSYSFCLTGEQGAVVEQLGATCDTTTATTTTTAALQDDPLDTACLIATITGGMDESTCLAATDSDGNKCEWCSLASYSFCLTEEQGATAEQFGATCDTGVMEEDDEKAEAAGVSGIADDPYDTACLIATIEGGMNESTCLAATDSDGTKCEWCTIGSSLNLCLTQEQAQTAEQFGVTCEEKGDEAKEHASTTSTNIV